MLTAALALGLAIQTPEPKALVLFFDGFLPGAVTPEVMPNVHRLKEEGAWSLRARCEDTTISGSGWSTFLTGVHRDKHGVPDNEFAAPNYGPHPLFLRRLEEARPGAVCAIAQSWRPIERHLVAPAEPDFSFYAEYDLAADDYFDGFSVDAMCADAARIWLAEPRLDCVVVMFDESDGVGHLEENGHYDAADPLYRRKLAEIDAHVGRLLAAIEARPGRAAERWLIAVHTDHAGERGEGHGRNKPSHREAPFILHGRGVVRGEIWPPPKSPDLVASVMKHFGAEPKPEWGLDGRAVGFDAAGPPLAWFHDNLLVNPDAEAERGFDPASGVDASVFGWDDPGAVSVAPAARGQCFFAPAAASMSQRVDLLPLQPWLARGAVAFEHSPELELRLLDEGGAPSADGSAPRYAEVVLRLAAGARADDLFLRALPRTREALPEWRPLFDGRSLDGWIPVNVAPETFAARDGMIVCDGKPTGVLRSARSYRDFVLEFEYQHRVPGGNAGLFVWSDPLPALGVPFARSIEVQIIDGWETENWTSHGDVFAIWGATMQPDRPHPAGWERCLPSQRRAHPAGQWNRFRVVAAGGAIQLWVNGQPVSGGTRIAPAEGFLCLESEGGEVWFRDLRILELTPGSAPVPADWRPLYSGRDLRGFVDPGAGWSAQDWRLVAAAGAPALTTSAPLAPCDVQYDRKPQGADKWERVSARHAGGVFRLEPPAGGCEYANLLHRP